MRSSMFFFTTLVAFTFAAASRSPAQSQPEATFTDLHDFSSYIIPGGIVLDAAGNLYGSLNLGGGAVFELVLPGASLNILHTFSGPPDGAGPNAPLALDRAGNIYGTTRSGGSHNAGTVFMLSRSGSQWLERVLYSFTGNADGGYPAAGVNLDSTGQLLGTTTAGGQYGHGTVFRFNVRTFPVATVLHSFGSAADASNPIGTLVTDSAGNLYGEADGGAYPNGIVYRLSQIHGSFGWAETVLYAFTNGTDGRAPNGGLVFTPEGNLFGTTSDTDLAGCGTVFELIPGASGAWTYTLVYTFGLSGSSDGCFPLGPVTIDAQANVYVATVDGGTNNTGTLDELTTAGGQWTEATLLSFPQIFLFNAVGGLVLDSSGNFFGAFNSDNHAGVYEVMR